MLPGPPNVQDYRYFFMLPGPSTFPNDYIYDAPYEEVPKNVPTGVTDIPNQPRRHRLPDILVKTKPQNYKAKKTGFYYQIPQYPPYVYWYPNPMECRDVCGTKVCNDYFKRMNDYRMCRFCQNLKDPQCWDSKLQRCVTCNQSQALKRCEDQYGCQNPNSYLGWQDNGAPINPKYTGCKMCQ